MNEMRYRYLVALSESTNADHLEELLNEKASDGWELFMLHEVDSRMGKAQYNCIFYKLDEVKSSEEGEHVEIVDITDFQKRMEKIYNKKDAYNEYIEIQQKIINTQREINKTKKSLEASTDEKERNDLNNKILEKINQLNELKKEMPRISDSYRLYDRIKADKITIYLSEELIELTEKGNEDNLVVRNIKLRQNLTDKYAYVIPNIRYSDGVELEPFQYRIDIREVPAATGFVYPGYRMIYKGQSNITRKPRKAISAEDPVYFLNVYWIPELDTKNYWEKGASASDVIAQHLAQICIKHCQELLDYKDLNKYIDIVRSENFELAENVVPEVISMGDLRFILARLIKERVPVKDITFIFEKIMDLYNYAVEKELLLEKLRVILKRQISFSICTENNVIHSITIDPNLEKYLKDHTIIPDHTNPFIDLNKEETEKLMTATAKIIEKAAVKIEHTAIVTSPAIRQAIFDFYEDYIPGLSVLAYEEISSEIVLDEIGTLARRILYRKSKTTN